MCEDDEVVDSRIFVLGILGENMTLLVGGEFEEEEVLEDADIFLVAVVGGALVFALFAVDRLHLLFEPQLLHHLLHAA